MLKAKNRIVQLLQESRAGDIRPHRVAGAILPPENWEISEVRELLGSLSLDNAPSAELANYLNEDFERFLITWNLLRNHSGIALEIGANPYFTTILLREFSNLTMTLTNSFDSNSKGKSSQAASYSYPKSKGSVSFSGDFEYENINVEIDLFPYENESFDVVIFCEVIEHLISDPVSALNEMSRVLKPGGTLIVSTPNVARLENVSKMIVGENIYDPYSGYGPYGRHNREFTRHEIVHLLQFCGFSVNNHFTTDVHSDGALSLVPAGTLKQLVSHRKDDLGQYLFCVATKSEVGMQGRPNEIYRSLPLDQLTSWSQ